MFFFSLLVLFVHKQREMVKKPPCLPPNVILRKKKHNQSNENMPKWKNDNKGKKMPPKMLQS